MRISHGDLLAASSGPHLGVQFLPFGQEVTHGRIRHINDAKAGHVHAAIVERTQVDVVHTLTDTTPLISHTIYVTK